MARFVLGFALAFPPLLCLNLLAAGPTAPKEHPLFRPGRILLQPKAGVDLARLTAVHGQLQGHIRRHYPPFGNLQEIELPKAADIPKLLARYRETGLVQFAEPDFWVYPALEPNDPRFLDGSLWHLNNTGQSGGLNDADIDAPEAWDTLSTASNIVIAIVDTGVRYTHEDLAGNMWVNPGEIPGNGIDDDGNGFIDDVHGINAAAGTGDPVDFYGHGTQVAGMAGAVGNNGKGVAGIAWHVKLMACRFYDDTGNASITDLIQCLDYARAKGAQIINASFVTTNYSSSLYTALNNCRAAGIIVAAAAGNDAANNDATPYYPASYNLDNIVAIAATTRTDTLADYSNYGANSVDLGAPATAIYTTYYSSDSSYVLNSGTSFAAPVVAGAFALMKVRYPVESYHQLIDRVLAATDPLPSLAGKCVTGGRLNLYNALGPSVIADFTPSVAVGAAPLSVTFTNTSYGTITNSFWDFGDGATTNALNPVHTFSTEGNFNVTLTITSDTGRTSSKTRPISVIANYLIAPGTYEWLDPVNTNVLALSNDGVSPAQSLPFPFNFYGQTYSQLYVGANGLIGFDSAGLNTPINTDLPNPSAPNNMLCPFWDDLNPGAGGSVYVGTVGAAPSRKFVITWLAVPHRSNPPTAFTFQVWLEESTQRIQFQYQAVDVSNRHPANQGKTATIGLEHASGLVGAKYSYNGSALLTNSQAILFLPSSAGGMEVLPATGFAASGNVGGPFSPPNRVYTITNSGAEVLNWSLSKSQPWISLSASNGSLPAARATNITVAINSSALALPAGSYLDTLSFQNTGNGLGNTTRAVSLSVNGTTGVLAVSPEGDYYASGPVGGPFSPSSQIYTLHNSGDATLTWSAQQSQPWISLSRTNGSLAAGESSTLTTAINTNANALAGGSYTNVITFENLTNGRGNTNRFAILTVNAPFSLALLAATPFSFKLEGQPGKTYVVQASEDLQNWTAVATNTADTIGVFTFTDSQPAPGQRFYRAKIWP